MITKHRNRRTAYEQLSSMQFCVKSIIESKGKHRGQFKRMDKKLQNYFLTLDKLLASVNAEYICFLYDQAMKNEKLAKKWLSEDLKEKLELLKKAGTNTLDLDEN